MAATPLYVCVFFVPPKLWSPTCLMIKTHIFSNMLIVHIPSTYCSYSQYWSYSQCLLFIFLVFIIHILSADHSSHTFNSFIVCVFDMSNTWKQTRLRCLLFIFPILIIVCVGFFSPIIYIIKKIILFIINLVDFKDYLFCHLFWAIGIFNKLFL